MRGVPNVLRSGEATANLLRAFYYKVLEEDERFREDLAALYVGLALPPIRHNPLRREGGATESEFPQAHTPDYPQLEVVDLLRDGPDEWDVRKLDWVVSAPAPDHIALIEPFRQRWAIPRRNVWDDLAWTFMLHSASKATNPPVRLLAIQHGVSPSLPPLRIVLLPDIAIAYEPTTAGTQISRDIEHRLRSIMRENVRSQLAEWKEKVKAAGITGLPPRWRDPEEVERLARRLYMRAVCRMTWSAIAESTHVSEETTKSTVRHWARRLEVDLPRLPAGRPRGAARREKG